MQFATARVLLILLFLVSIVSAWPCACNDCCSCSIALGIDPNCDSISYASPNTSMDGSCYISPNACLQADGIQNKVFDCGGHHFEVPLALRDSPFIGINLSNSRNITFKNCNFWYFKTGVLLSNSPNITIKNTNITGGGNETVGVNSTNSIFKLYDSYVCFHNPYDMYSDNWLTSYGEENSCDVAQNWIEDVYTGECTYRCIRETEPPNITLISPGNDTYPTRYPIQFTAKATDNSGLAMSCALLINGIVREVKQFQSGVEATYDYKYFPLTLGKHVWKVICKDRAKNKGYSENFTFNVIPAVCECTDKSSCETAMASPTCVTISLMNNITIRGTFINYVSKFTKKTFDCGGNQIIGDKTGSAFVLWHGNNNIRIQNCEISNFTYGINNNLGGPTTYNANNSFISNRISNTVAAFYFPITVSGGSGTPTVYSNNNTFIANTVSNSTYGWYFYAVSSCGYGCRAPTSDSNKFSGTVIRNTTYGVYMYAYQYGASLSRYTFSDMQIFNSTYGIYINTQASWSSSSSDSHSFSNINMENTTNGIYVYHYHGGYQSSSTGSYRFSNVSISNAANGIYFYTYSASCCWGGYTAYAYSNSHSFSGINLYNSTNGIYIDANSNSVGVTSAESNTFNNIIASGTTNPITLNGYRLDGTLYFSSHKLYNINISGATNGIRILLNGSLYSSLHSLANISISNTKNAIIFSGPATADSTFGGYSLSNITVFNATTGINTTRVAFTLTRSNISNGTVGLNSTSSVLTLTNNYICFNSRYDLYSANWLTSSGTNNSCNLFDGWTKEYGAFGCSNVCDPEVIFGPSEDLPFIQLISPENNADVDVYPTLFNFTVMDNDSETFNCGFMFDNTTIMSNDSVINGNITTFSYYPKLGTHKWKIQCYDAYGNRNTSEEWMFKAVKGTCYCYDKPTCENAVQIDSCGRVILQNNVSLNGTFIDYFISFGNKSFECNGTSIIGNGAGAAFSISHNNSYLTIKNCIISNFTSAFYSYMYAAPCSRYAPANTNNLFMNLSISDSQYGFYSYLYSYGTWCPPGTLYYYWGWSAGSASFNSHTFSDLVINNTYAPFYFITANGWQGYSSNNNHKFSNISISNASTAMYAYTSSDCCYSSSSANSYALSGINITQAEKGIYFFTRTGSSYYASPSSSNSHRFSNISISLSPPGRFDSPGLVGYWSLNNVSGTTTPDSSIYKNNGTLYYSPAQITGKYGNALSFNGYNQNIYFSYSVPVNDFTFAAWVKPIYTHEIDGEATSGYPGVYSQRYAFGADNGGGDSGAGLSVGTNGVSVYEHGNSYMPALAVYNGNIGTEWTHITVVYRNKQPHIYINGTLVRTGLTSPRANVYAPTHIGCGSYGCFPGYMDEVMIWNRALSDAEVMNVSNPANLPWLTVFNPSYGLYFQFEYYGQSNSHTFSGVDISNATNAVYIRLPYGYPYANSYSFSNLNIYDSQKTVAIYADAGQANSYTFSNVLFSNSTYGFIFNGGNTRYHTISNANISGTQYAIYAINGNFTLRNSVFENNVYGIYGNNTAMSLSNNYICRSAPYDVYSTIAKSNAYLSNNTCLFATFNEPPQTTYVAGGFTPVVVCPTKCPNTDNASLVVSISSPMNNEVVAPSAPYVIPFNFTATSDTFENISWCMLFVNDVYVNETKNISNATTVSINSSVNFRNGNNSAYVLCIDGYYNVNKSQVVNFTLGPCYCSTKDECNKAVNASTCYDIRLNASISMNTNFIEYIRAFTGKSFDCQGNTITGTRSAVKSAFILGDQNSHNSIRNCRISNFSYGVYTYFSDNNQGSLANTNLTFSNLSFHDSTYGFYTYLYCSLIDSGRYCRSAVASNRSFSNISIYNASYGFYTVLQNINPYYTIPSSTSNYSFANISIYNSTYGVYFYTYGGGACPWWSYCGGTASSASHSFNNFNSYNVANAISIYGAYYANTDKINFSNIYMYNSTSGILLALSGGSSNSHTFSNITGSKMGANIVISISATYWYWSTIVPATSKSHAFNNINFTDAAYGIYVFSGGTNTSSYSISNAAFSNVSNPFQFNSTGLLFCPYYCYCQTAYSSSHKISNISISNATTAMLFASTAMSCDSYTNSISVSNVSILNATSGILLQRYASGASAYSDYNSLSNILITNATTALSFSNTTMSPTSYTYSRNNAVSNLTVTGANIGINAQSASFTMLNSNITSTGMGINSTNSTLNLTTNFICYNSMYDLYSSTLNWPSSTGINNTCFITTNWNDVNPSGGGVCGSCTYACPSSSASGLTVSLVSPDNNSAVELNSPYSTNFSYIPTSDTFENMTRCVLFIDCMYRNESYGAPVSTLSILSSAAYYYGIHNAYVMCSDPYFTTNVSNLVNFSVGTCYCSSKAECEAALNSTICQNVYLTSNISINGTFIQSLVNFHNKTFDCQWNNIRGNKTGTGITVSNGSYNTVRNCKISNFAYAVDISISGWNGSIYTTNNTFTNISIVNATFAFYQNLNPYGQSVYDNITRRWVWWSCPSIYAEKYAFSDISIYNVSYGFYSARSSYYSATSIGYLFSNVNISKAMYGIYFYADPYTTANYHTFANMSISNTTNAFYFSAYGSYNQGSGGSTSYYNLTDISIRNSTNAIKFDASNDGWRGTAFSNSHSLSNIYIENATNAIYFYGYLAGYCGGWACYGRADMNSHTLSNITITNATKAIQFGYSQANLPTNCAGQWSGCCCTVGPNSNSHKLYDINITNSTYGIMFTGISNSDVDATTDANYVNGTKYGVYVDRSSNISINKVLADLNNYSYYIFNSSARITYSNATFSSYGVYAGLASLYMEEVTSCFNRPYDVYNATNWIFANGTENQCTDNNGWNDYDDYGCVYECPINPNNAPRVNITKPLNGSVITKMPLNISAKAWDLDFLFGNYLRLYIDIDGVNVYLDRNYLNNSNMSFEYNDSMLMSGEHSIRVRARDLYKSEGAMNITILLQLNMCPCSSCAECNSNILDERCDVIILTNNISASGNCIANLTKQFDCNGSTMTGSGNGTGILTGSMILKTGDALRFNWGNYIYAPIGSHFGGNNQLTAEAWVYMNASTNGPIFGVTNCPPGYCWNMPFLSANGMTVYGWIWGVNGNSPLSHTITTVGWHHLAITYDPSSGGRERFYVDGVQVGTGTGGYSPSGGYNYFTTFISGAKPSGVNYYFVGQLDEVKVWNKALSAREINLSRDGVISLSNTSLAGYWSFNNASNRMKDSSKSGYNGYISGATNVTGITLNYVGGSIYSANPRAVQTLIHNCTITKFEYAVYSNYTNTTMLRSNITNNTYGVFLLNNGKSTFTNNSFTYNKNMGVFSSNSSLKATSNYMCFNSEFDIVSNTAWGKLSSGTGNTCSQGNWNDDKKIGCTKVCDMIPPNVTLNSTPNSAMLANTTVQLVFNVTDNIAPMLDCTAVVSDENLGNLTYGITATNGSLTTVTAENLSEGVHSWYVVCYDQAGNMDMSDTWTFTIDITPPQVILEWPENNYTTYDPNIVFNFSVVDNFATEMECMMVITDAMFGLINLTLTAENGTTTSFPFGGLYFGYHYWNVTCFDAVNNSAVSETWYFIITYPTGEMCLIDDQCPLNMCCDALGMCGMCVCGESNAICNTRCPLDPDCTTCTADAYCPVCARCINGTCDAMLNVSDGECESSECTLDLDCQACLLCTPEQECINLTCVDCGADDACNPQCPDDPDCCSADWECPIGSECMGSECIDCSGGACDCTLNGECNLLCPDDADCCFSWFDCPFGQSCIQNLCVDCREDGICHNECPFDPDCYECIDDSDCDAFEKCKDYECVPSPPGKCTNNSDCTSGLCCMVNECQLCPECGADGVCNSQCESDPDCILNMTENQTGCAYNNPACGECFSCADNVCVEQLEYVQIDAPLEVPLNTLVTAVLRDFAGSPVPGYTISIMTPEGRIEERISDANGIIMFSATEEGAYAYDLPPCASSSVSEVRITYAYNPTTAPTSKKLVVPFYVTEPSKMNMQVVSLGKPVLASVEGTGPKRINAFTTKNGTYEDILDVPGKYVFTITATNVKSLSAKIDLLVLPLKRTLLEDPQFQLFAVLVAGGIALAYLSKKKIISMLSKKKIVHVRQKPQKAAAGEEVILTFVDENGDAMKSAAVSVISESGETTDTRTDGRGRIIFIPSQPGTYFISSKEMVVLNDKLLVE